jgi:hypothetical protein
MGAKSSKAMSFSGERRCRYGVAEEFLLRKVIRDLHSHAARIW